MRRVGSALMLFLIAGLGACGDSEGPSTSVIYGEPLTVGNGEARTYIVANGGEPSEIGVALSGAALEGLPAPTGGFPDSHVYLLPLPDGNSTGYQVVELDWNPAGHPPPMVYTVPHFDFHFYTQSAAGRSAILPTDPEFGAKAANLPDESLRPAGYVVDQAGGQVQGVPMMGVHWLNPASPEFHGEPFTSTFVYGSWDGAFTFVEPMVAYDYLKTKPDTEATIVVPTTFAAEGSHPTGYRITWDDHASEYRIGITGLKAN